MCKLCEIKPVYEFTNQRKLCAKCFVRYFQKKVLYTIRRFGLVKKGDVIGYEKSNNFRAVVLEEVLKMFAEKADVKIVKLLNKKVDKIAVDFTIDLCADEFVEKIIDEDVKNLNGLKVIDKKIIRPLYLFLDVEVLLYAILKQLNFKEKKYLRRSSKSQTKEVLLYARLKKLKFKKVEKINSEIGIFINELEKKHPEIKRAIVNSFLKL